MVKRKASAPQRFTGEDRRELSWNLGDGELQQSLSRPVLHANLDECHSNKSSTPINGSTAKLKKPCYRKKSKGKHLAHLVEDLQELIKDSDFLVNVFAPSVAAPAESFGKLGRLPFTLCDSTRQRSDVFRATFGCFIYISRKPHRSFVYDEWEHSVGSIGACTNCSRNTLQKNGTSHAIYSRINSTNMPDYELLKALSNKKYALQLVDDGDNNADGLFELDVYLMKCAVVQVSHLTETKRTRDCACVRKVMSHFCGLPSLEELYYTDVESICDSGVENLYDAVKRYHEREVDDQSSEMDVQHPDLLPVLRPYQVDAVRWMMRRELFGFADFVSHRTHNQNDKLLHPLYFEVKLFQDGPTLFFNPYGGYLTAEKPLNNHCSPGGILADEMGLGKTVEVLAAILTHPRPISAQPIYDVRSPSDGFFPKSAKREKFFECICGEDASIGGVKSNSGTGQKIQCQKCGLWQHVTCVKYHQDNSVLTTRYYCPHCWILMPQTPSRATLIVSPAPIIHQWLDEIQKHVKHNSLKILMYEGVQNDGFIQPPTLADHDIVVMSYATLRKEIDYVDLPHSKSAEGRRFRHPKRFMAVPSPLVAVEWWRVCLDEAQMVEYSTTKAAEMALRLAAVNRWCITGTPLQKSINDLYGLVLLLRLDPYCVRTWWNECLAEPYLNYRLVEPLHRVISVVLWRTAKKDVLDQIGLPAQTDEVTWLSFTPVEEHVYRRQHIECTADMVAVLSRFCRLDTKLEALDRNLVDKWLAPLLHLRKACCHPQIVRGKYISLRKSTMTMEQLLDDLVKKVTLECEEQHRLLVAALNGLAGIHIIQQEWSEAVERYREVLRSASEIRPSIKTDKLQRLHAMNNLVELFDAKHEGIEPTDDEENLRQEANDLRSKYLEKCSNKVRDSREVLKQAVATVKEVFAEFKRTDLPWWTAILWWAIDTKRDRDIVSRIKSDILKTFMDFELRSFRDCVGLRFYVTRRIDKLNESRVTLLNAVLALEDSPSAEEIDYAVECHLRRKQAKPKKCVYCNIHDLFNCYESELFLYEEFKQSNEVSDPMGRLRRGTWASGETEQILRGILAAARLMQDPSTPNGMQKEWIEDGHTEMKLFEAFKKEFRSLRGLWMQLTDQVSALDELNIANTRLRLCLPNESPQPAVLQKYEVPTHKLKLASDRIVANNELKKMLGQLLYLQNLAKSEYGKRGGSNPDLCPVCRLTLGTQWCVLQCGHCFCEECVRVLTINYRGFNSKGPAMKCAVCRYLTAVGEISHVCTTIDTTLEQNDVEVQGSHSTKVEAIVRKLMQIRADDPLAKTLVFSTWEDVLDLLAKALAQNKVTFCSFKARNKLQDNLDLFKVDPEIGVLLLPVQCGSNGLNLIEATHVILVEPILNPAKELQAIGRVHRIGQTKPTVVHRFLVRTTVEEHIHNVLDKVRDTCNDSNRDTETNPLTVRDLLDIATRSSLKSVADN